MAPTSLLYAQDNAQGAARSSVASGAVSQGARRKKVVILATGGTIAGVGEEGKSTGYASGQLSVDDLLKDVPQLSQVADVEAYQVCNVNSDDITAPIWLDLARTIDDMSLRSDVTGFVVTHGTDTMDETAYFLNLALKTGKPVVVTGSMRPSTATSADGPMNLYQAVVTAAAAESRAKGVLVAFSGRLYNARDVQKTSTHSMTTMSGGENGSCGTIRDDKIFYTSQTTKLHTGHTEFDVSELVGLPKVSVLYFNVDADPDLIAFAAQRSQGLVIAGAGGGEFSQRFARAIAALDIPVVVSSRVGSGVIMSSTMVCKNAIPGNDLPPMKAAVLLRLALTVTQNPALIARMFDVY